MISKELRKSITSCLLVRAAGSAECAACGSNAAQSIATSYVKKHGQQEIISNMTIVCEICYEACIAEQVGVEELKHKILGDVCIKVDDSDSEDQDNDTPATAPATAPATRRRLRRGTGAGTTVDGVPYSIITADQMRHADQLYKWNCIDSKEERIKHAKATKFSYYEFVRIVLEKAGTLAMRSVAESLGIVADIDSIIWCMKSGNYVLRYKGGINTMRSIGVLQY